MCAIFLSHFVFAVFWRTLVAFGFVFHHDWFCRLYNKLSIRLLNAVSGLSDEAGTLSCGGPDRRFWGASVRRAKGDRRLIFSDPKRDFAEMGTAFEKVTVRWRMSRVILGLWSGQGHLSSYNGYYVSLHQKSPKDTIYFRNSVFGGVVKRVGGLTAAALRGCRSRQGSRSRRRWC